MSKWWVDSEGSRICQCCGIRPSVKGTNIGNGGSVGGAMRYSRLHVLLCLLENMCGASKSVGCCWPRERERIF